MNHKIESFGKAIKYIRKLNKYSQEDIAKKLEYSKQYISRIEHGQIKSIPADRLSDIAGKLRVSQAFLLGLTENIDLLPPRALCYLWEHPEAYSKKLREEITKFAYHHQVKNYMFPLSDFQPGEIRNKIKKALDSINDYDLLEIIEVIVCEDYNKIGTELREFLVTCKKAFDLFAMPFEALKSLVYSLFPEVNAEKVISEYLAKNSK